MSTEQKMDEAIDVFIHSSQEHIRALHALNPDVDNYRHAFWHCKQAMIAAIIENYEATKPSKNI
jgi:hypothetical protein